MRRRACRDVRTYRRRCQHRIAEVRIEHGAGRQIEALLAAQRALRVVAFARIGNAVEQRVDRLIAFYVANAQRLARFQFLEPWLAGGQGSRKIASAGSSVLVVRMDVVMARVPLKKESFGVDKAARVFIA